MTDRLVAIVDGRIAGHVTRSRNGRLGLSYADEWQADPDAFPLSLSMPLAARDHAHAWIEPWLWGLLPDNDVILGRWGARFHVSPRNAFDLLAHVGEDCPGALQLVPPEKVDTLLLRPGRVEWLTEKAIAERLRLLRRDPSAWRMAGDTGQFSLAGAQPKTALIHRNGRWGVPSGRLPTTHILKPADERLPGHSENEHVCLELARSLGLPAAHSQVLAFDNEVAIVVARYDRLTSGSTVRRVHQEDLCQALGCPPTRKYQNQGGPGATQIVDFLRVQSALPLEDVWTFIEALAFNWLIGGTDAHAKNYSMLIGAGGRARLAPLYDVASILPYDHDRRKLKLAMSIGREYRLDAVGARQWARLGERMRLPKQELQSRLHSLVARLPDAIEDVVRASIRSGLDRKTLAHLSHAMHAHIATCRRELG